MAPQQRSARVLPDAEPKLLAVEPELLAEPKPSVAADSGLGLGSDDSSSGEEEVMEAGGGGGGGDDDSSSGEEEVMEAGGGGATSSATAAVGRTVSGALVERRYEGAVGDEVRKLIILKVTKRLAASDGSMTTTK